MYIQRPNNNAHLGSKRAALLKSHVTNVGVNCVHVYVYVYMCVYALLLFLCESATSARANAMQCLCTHARNVHVCECICISFLRDALFTRPQSARIHAQTCVDFMRAVRVCVCVYLCKTQSMYEYVRVYVCLSVRVQSAAFVTCICLYTI